MIASSHLQVLYPVANGSLDDLVKRVRGFVLASRSAETTRAYRTDFEHFTNWCRRYSLNHLPATSETVALYVADCASTLKPGTIRRRLTAINQAHRGAGFPDSPASMRNELVQKTMKGVRRVLGVRQHGKAALLTDDIRRLSEDAPDTLLGFRNRALFLTGYAGFFRRSELASICLPDLEFTSQGVIITLRASKTDQEGQGSEVGIPYGADPATCPVLALKTWIKAAGIGSGAGPIFRAVNRHGQVSGSALSASSIPRILKHAARLAGYPPGRVSGLSSHSLRVGGISEGAAVGVSERDLMRQSRQKSVTTLRRYIRRAGVFTANAASRLGL